MKRKIALLMTIATLAGAFGSVSFASVANYFKGWSETNVEYVGNSITGYNLHKKRAVASSTGYRGRHYLRAYVTNYPATDTNRVFRDVGFTLYSKWASQPNYPVAGIAKSNYGY